MEVGEGVALPEIRIYYKVVVSKVRGVDTEIDY